MLVVHVVVEAMDWCRETMGADPKHWQWGKAHVAKYRHSNPEVCNCSYVVIYLVLYIYIYISTV